MSRKAQTPSSIKSTLLDAAKARSRRSSLSDSIRKNKREESLQKRRANLSTAQGATDDATEASLVADAASTLTALRAADGGVRDALYSGDEVRVLDATTRIRKMLSIERAPPIDDVIQLNVVPRLVALCVAAVDAAAAAAAGFGQGAPVHVNQALALEAAWALTNVASGSKAQTMTVVAAGGVDAMLRLLAHADEAVRDQAVWCIGNVAGDGAELRDLCLQRGVLDGLLAQFRDGASVSIIRNATWAVSNICRGKPQPAFAAVIPALAVLEHLVRYPDQDVLVDACWALSYLTDGADDKIEVVCRSVPMIQRLVELLEHDSMRVVTPALRCVGNIVTGTEHQTQIVVDAMPFPALAKLIKTSTKRAVRKEACWAISNVTAGTEAQIQAVLECGLMPVLASVLNGPSDHDVRKEACWAVSNATSGGSASQVRTFVTPELLSGLVKMLAGAAAEAKMLLVALEALEHILAAGDMPNGANLYTDALEEEGLIDQLEALQDHPSEKVYAKCVEIIDEYFPTDSDDEGEVEAEATASDVLQKAAVAATHSTENASNAAPAAAFSFGSSAGGGGGGGGQQFSF